MAINYVKYPNYLLLSGNDHNEIKITNSNNRLDNIGHNLKNKKILIEGNVGFGLAKNMDSGEIILKGNAGDNACSGMRGGSVSYLEMLEMVYALCQQVKIKD